MKKWWCERCNKEVQSGYFGTCLFCGEILILKGVEYGGEK